MYFYYGTKADFWVVMPFLQKQNSPLVWRVPHIEKEGLLERFAVGKWSKANLKLMYTFRVIIDYYPWTILWEEVVREFTADFH